MPLKEMTVRHPHGSPHDKAQQKSTCLKSLKTERKRTRCGQCHISIFRLCSIAQARFGEVRFSEQETDLARKSLTFVYITETFSTGNSWGSVCPRLSLSYSLRILGTFSNNVISPFLRIGLNFDLFKTELFKIKRHDSTTRAVLTKRVRLEKNTLFPLTAEDETRLDIERLQ